MVTIIDKFSENNGDTCAIPEDYGSNKYWWEANELIKSWAHYQEVRIKFQNALSFETSSLAKMSQNNDIKQLNAKRVFLSERVEEKLKHFKRVCEEYGVEPVDRDWLTNNLPTEESSIVLHKRCSRRIFKGCPVKSLREII